MNFEWIFKIPHILHKLGVTDAVLSPGSRSAPLTLAFARNKGINKYIILDERSAGYIALGLALATNKPVAIICTSGTAVSNLYPAVIEAYYQKIPLIVLTADRPPEWIDQGDGQTIRQEDIFRNHTKKSYSFPVPTEHEIDKKYDQMIIGAVLKSCQLPAGPVHLNMPFREPLYPSEKVNEIPEDIIDVDDPEISTSPNIDEKLEGLNEYEKILLIAGQNKKNEDISKVIQCLTNNRKIPVVSEIISNLQPKQDLIVSHDLFLDEGNPQQSILQPDLIITLGDAILSKNLKVFLRKGSAQHWQISEDKQATDVFKKNCQNINVKPYEFINGWLDRSDIPCKVQESFYRAWLNAEKGTRSVMKSFPALDPLSEMEAVRIIFESVPEKSIIHLGNSMPVRWANYCQSFDKNFEYYSNRGTSGIDGCVSTAVGVALSSTNLNFLIVGDMAFFYDRNGLWHDHIPSNLRIIILNNHGGGIFRMIDGPSKQPEYDEYFETHHSLTALNTAKDFNLAYYSCKDQKSLVKNLSSFIIDDEQAKILEIETNSVVNNRNFINLISKINNIWN